MKLSILLSFFSSLALAAPVLETRQQPTLCSPYGYWSGNGYELLNNLWGQDSATSGSQCISLSSSSSTGVSWSTNWTWTGGKDLVKSYAYSGKQIAKGKLINNITSMPTSVSWKYNTEAVRANVAYDIFTAADPNHVNSYGDYEIMIWLARLNNVYPIGGDLGIRSIGGRSYNLWIGMNGNMKVFSFVAVGNQYDWNGDTKLFFNYLRDNEGYPVATQNLIVFQFGTEAFVGGPANMTVSKFTAAVN
ncbi:glycoside hydrolase family 12 protein [Podospora fimiseda]|uniref:Glycoside hydrolase family 12 protein n=1 Tax=Podospora fimiseda TaxID=252190 RepID=A0AAN7BML6_9PEZI|nr:glycoside hydrolase family 12 protein [Podospora fimiseda]